MRRQLLRACSWLTLAPFVPLWTGSAVAQVPGGTGGPAINQSLGRFHAGPFHVTPYLRINAITLDTNVFYDADNRVTDVHASGGPGLRLAVPVGKTLRIDLDGELDYKYYVKTSELRHLTGRAVGSVTWDTNFMRLGLGRTYRNEFDRPGSEVYGLVSRETWSTHIDLEFKKLERSRRLTASTILRANRIDVGAGQEYAGVDLAAASNRDVYLAGLELSYKLTDKTSLVAAGEYELNRYVEDETRDADVLRVYGGFRLSSETRLSGELLAGIDEVRPRNSVDVSKRTAPYVRARLAYRFGSKTILDATYNRGQGLSIYTVTDGFPTRQSETVGARLTRKLTDRLDLWIFGSFSRFRTDDPVEDEDGTAEPLKDEYRHGGVNLGYAFRDKIRVGVEGRYQERDRRNVSDLGIDGLQLGMTVTYTPN